MSRCSSFWLSILWLRSSYARPVCERFGNEKELANIAWGMHKSPGAQPQHLCFQARQLSVQKAPWSTLYNRNNASYPCLSHFASNETTEGFLTAMLSKNGRYLSHTLFILFYRHKKNLYFIVIVLTIWKAVLGSNCSYIWFGSYCSYMFSWCFLRNLPNNPVMHHFHFPDDKTLRGKVMYLMSNSK